CFDYHIKKCDGPCEGLISQDAYNAMIGEVVQILKGKTSSLVKTLRETMEQASAAQRFEAAASLRDKIRALSVYTDRQKVVDPDIVDRDLFALAADGDDACGVVFKVRDGKIIGRHHFYMAGVEGKEEKEILEQFLERYYLDAQDIPREIFLPIEIESTETVERWLATRTEEPVRIVVPRIGEKAKLLAMCKNNATLLLGMLKLQRQKNREVVPASLKALQRDLRLAKPPRRIECFDISNIQGADSVASMVVFVDGKPRKSAYRKFKIKTVQGPNDFASMQEVIGRRYTRLIEEHGEMPGLVVVDGGKGQLSSATGVLEKLGLRNRAPNPDLPIIGLAKRLEEVFVPEAVDPQSISKTSPGLKLLQRIRDEAHRFAITYHRTLRTNRTLRTELDLIEGVGKKRAKMLLELFGSVQGVRFATAEQLAEVVGEKVATRIKDYFGEDEEPGTEG
ncbi:MAG TPA: excinuclease ABC subunit UvrC, partial [Bacteroidota bacterium]|nr:excinuclease ABC subunit UvrC [Bacteroidota bacterium]